MKSYKVTEFGQPLQVMEEAAPTPTGSEILLRVASCGVCHSDIHLHDGYFDLGGGRQLDMSKSMPLPHTLGHEIVGEVVATGPDASGVEAGSKWLVFPWIGCGECGPCLSGNEHLCGPNKALGVSAPGGFSDHVLVPHPRYLVDYGNVPDSVACTYACSGLTAYSALKKAEVVSDKDPVLIIGAGGVGQSAIGLCQTIYGVAPTVADIDEGKREHALALGAAAVIDPAEETARKQLLKDTGGGFGTVIDFVGAESSVAFGLSVLRKGGKLIVVGLFGGSIEIPLATVPMRAITMSGSYVGSLAELEELAALGREGKIPGISVSTRDLSDVQETLDQLRAGKIEGRAVLQTTK